MMVPLLLASLLAVAPEAPASSAADPTVSFAQSRESRHARLLEGVELAATYKPSLNPALRITDATRLGLLGTPAALDTGGGVDADSKKILALVLGLFLGFGTGHLVAGDTNGFILFLVVDVAIIVVSVVLKSVVGGWFWGLGGLALLASHVIQGLDAYHSAGGPALVESARENAVLVSDATGGRDVPPMTTRAFAFSF